MSDVILGVIASALWFVVVELMHSRVELRRIADWLERRK